MESEIKETGCCQIFDPAKWDNQVVDWDNKTFIKRSVFTLFYMPIGFGKTISQMFNNMTLDGATCPDNLALSDHTSMFNMDLYVATDKNVANEENVTLSGKMFIRVYDGSFNKTGSFMKEYYNEAKIKGYNIEKTYMHYAYCPKCSKAYKHNYISIFGKTS